MTDLLPCPFCGGSASIDNGPPELWFVTCGECGVDGKIKHDEQSAIAAWNRRTVPDTHVLPAESQAPCRIDDAARLLTYAIPYRLNCILRGECVESSVAVIRSISEQVSAMIEAASQGSGE